MECRTAGIAEVEHDLHTTSGSISLSLSLYILMQGGFPVIWSAVSEIVGRKVCTFQRYEGTLLIRCSCTQKVYICSLTLCMVGCIVAGVADSIGLLTGMRCVQGAGSVIPVIYQVFLILTHRYE